MSFRARLALRISLLVALTGLIGITALVGMTAGRGHFDAAQDQYGRLRAVFEIGHRAALARALLHAGSEARHIREDAWRDAGSGLNLEDIARDPQFGPLIRRVDRTLEDGSAASELDAVLGEVATLAGAIQGEIVENRAEATRRFGLVMIGIASLGALGLAAGLWIGVAQYRSVMKPLSHLLDGVDTMASGNFSVRLEQEGDAEFRVLIDRFNTMGERLHLLTTAMEQEVAQTSRELIRAERLASVGVLAAGVAHEINNPLAIIAGYAQASLRRLERSNGHANSLDPELYEALSIINDEVFRSRAITDQLLDLARPADGEVDEIDLTRVVRRALALIDALPQRAGRRIVPEFEGTRCVVAAREAELLQVLINLLSNALEATSAEDGELHVSCGIKTGCAVVSIADNGRGMTAEEIERVFEPFWSSKGSGAPSGRGLGLAVSHAIVLRHDGRLSAHSDGRGWGTEWRLELPLARPAAGRAS